MSKKLRQELTKEELQYLRTHDIDKFVKLEFTENEKKLNDEINQDRERLRLEKVARLAEAAKPLVSDLRNAGISFEHGVWDIIGDQEKCVKVLPVLAQHLECDYPPEIQDGIARAMAWPEAMDWRPDFIRLFKQRPLLHTYFRQGLVLGIRNTTGPHNVWETIDIMRDPSLGEERVLIVSLFARVKEEEVRQAILELREHDPEMVTAISQLSWVKKLDKELKKLRSQQDKRLLMLASITHSAEAHNAGDAAANSPFTSWTSNPEIAATNAAKNGAGGVVLRVPQAALPAGASWSWELSPDIYNESEVLMRGIRSGVEVLK